MFWSYISIFSILNRFLFGILMFPPCIKRNIIVLEFLLSLGFIHGIYFGLTKTDNLKCCYLSSNLSSRLKYWVEVQGIRITATEPQQSWAAILIFLYLKLLTVKCFMWNVHQDDSKSQTGRWSKNNCFLKKIIPQIFHFPETVFCSNLKIYFSIQMFPTAISGNGCVFLII